MMLTCHVSSSKFTNITVHTHCSNQTQKSVNSSDIQQNNVILELQNKNKQTHKQNKQMICVYRVRPSVGCKWHDPSTPHVVMTTFCTVWVPCSSPT